MKQTEGDSIYSIFLCCLSFHCSNLKAPINHDRLSKQQHVPRVNKHTFGCLNLAGKKGCFWCRRLSGKTDLERTSVCDGSSATTAPSRHAHLPKNTPKSRQQPRFLRCQCCLFHKRTVVYQESIFNTNVCILELKPAGSRFLSLM